MAIINTIIRMITLRGVKDYTLNSKTSTGEVDPNYPTKGSIITVVSHPLSAYPAAITKKQKTFEIVKRGDIKFYVDPSEMVVVPTTDDTVSHPIKGNYNIVDIITYSDAGTPILYVFQLRQ